MRIICPRRRRRRGGLVSLRAAVLRTCSQGGVRARALPSGNADDGQVGFRAFCPEPGAAPQETCQDNASLHGVVLKLGVQRGEPRGACCASASIQSYLKAEQGHFRQREGGQETGASWYLALTALLRGSVSPGKKVVCKLIEHLNR